MLAPFFAEDALDAVDLLAAPEDVDFDEVDFFAVLEADFFVPDLVPLDGFAVFAPVLAPELLAVFFAPADLCVVEDELFLPADDELFAPPDLDVDFDAVPLDFELEVFDFAPAVDRDPDEPLLAEDLPPLFDEEDPLLAPVAVFALPSPKV